MNESQKTRSQTHELMLAAPTERVFRLLHTPSEIRAWWSARTAIVIPEPGGIWAASWGEAEDEPDYVCAARITHFDPPHRMCLGDYQYRSRFGPLPFEADFRSEFLVEARDTGTRLQVTQSGFPIESVADDYFQGCEQGWRDTLAGIKAFLGEGKPPSEPDRS